MTRADPKIARGRIPLLLRERPACLILLKRSIDSVPEPVNRLLPGCFAAIITTALGFPVADIYSEGDRPVSYVVIS
jgi:hypothetical protein